MVAPILYQIVNAVVAIFLFVIATNILIYGIKRKFSPSLVLAPAMYAFAALMTLDFLVGALPASEESLARVLMNLSTICIPIIGIAFVLYTDRISNFVLSPKTLLVACIGSITLGMALVEPWITEYSETGWVQHWNFAFTAILVMWLLFTLGNFLLILWSAYKEVTDINRRIIILIVLAGLIIAVVGAILVMFADEFLGITLLYKLDTYIFLLGMSLVGIAQLIDPLALYFVNAKIDVCGITGESGVPYVTYVPEGGLFDITLGTAAIAGVQALIKDVSRAEKHVKSLDSGDKKILFEYCKPSSCSGRLVGFIISNTETIGLRDALSHILISFVDQYEQNLDDIVDSTAFEPFKKEIEKNLSFAISKKGK